MIMRFSTCGMLLTVLMVIGTLFGSNNAYVYPKSESSKKIIEDIKHCKKLLSRQTEDICENRRDYCCRSGKATIEQPVCATTIYGFGMIFDNPCSLYYIRCMYPEVCFLKRSMDHPHCSLVLKQSSAFQICTSRQTTTSTPTLSTTRLPTTLSSTVFTQKWLATTETSTFLQTLLKTISISPAEVELPTSDISGIISPRTMQQTTSSSPSLISRTSSPGGSTPPTSNVNNNDTKTKFTTDVPTLPTSISTTTEPHSTSTIISTSVSGQSTGSKEIIISNTMAMTESSRTTLTPEEGVTKRDNMTQNISTTDQSTVSTYNSVTKEYLIPSTSSYSTTVDPPPECSSSMFVTLPTHSVSVCDATATRTRRTCQSNNKLTGTSFKKLKCIVPPPILPDCTFPIMDARGKT